LVPAGAVVVATRVGLGKVGWTDEPLCFSQDCQGLVFNQSCVGPLYLAYYLGQAVQGFKHVSRGTTISGVPKNELRDLLLLLPPLPEQRRIVAEIEKHLTRLDAAVAALKRTQANLKRYRASVLKAACEGRLVPTEAALARAEGREYEPASVLLERILKERETSPNPLRKRRGLRTPLSARGEGPGVRYTEPQPPDTSNLPPLPEGWVWATVEQLGTLGEQAVLTGPFGTNLRREDFQSEGVPILTIGCLTDDGIDLHRAQFISPVKAAELARYRLQPGDLLFSRMASVGRAGFVGEAEAGYLFNYHIMRLRLAPTALLPGYYLAFVRGSGTVGSYVESINHGATRDGINTNQLLRMPVALPPLAEQRRIVMEVERRLSVTQAAEQVVAANLKRAERLRQAVLKRAFEGKLAPQDPDDEPASVLLERIRAGRETSPNPLRARRGLATSPARARSSVTSSPLRRRRGAGGEVEP
jgi:type I restriction enzyme S subunit